MNRCQSRTCEWVFAPVCFSTHGRLGLRCGSVNRKVFERLSCTDGLFKPLGHLAIAGPRLSCCAAISCRLLPDLVLSNGGCNIVHPDSELGHSPAQVSDHAVPFSLIHCDFLSHRYCAEGFNAYAVFVPSRWDVFSLVQFLAVCAEKHCYTVRSAD